MAKNTNTEVTWRAVADEDHNGTLTGITLTRISTVIPVTSDGRKQWLRSTETREEFGPFAVAELPQIMRELTETLTYYADGSRARDRAIEVRG
jgi:hypothetical protein